MAAVTTATAITPPLVEMEKLEAPAEKSGPLDTAPTVAPSVSVVSPQSLIEIAKAEAGKLGIRGAYNSYSFYTQSSPDFPKKLKKAASAYAHYRPDETPLVLQDSTLFGSAKEGFVMTDKTFYVKQTLTSKTFVPISQILNIEIQPRSSLYYLILHTQGRDVDIFSSSDQAVSKNLQVLLEILIKTIQDN